MINDAINAQVGMWDNQIRNGRLRSEMIRIFKKAGSSAERAERGANLHEAAVKDALLGECYSVSDPILRLLRSSAETLPEWTLRPEDVMTKTGFVWFDRPIPFRYEDGGAQMEMRGFCWVTIPAGLYLMALVADSNRGVSPQATIAQFVMQWFYGESIVAGLEKVREDYENYRESKEEGWLDSMAGKEQHQKEGLLFATFLAFVQQRILVFERRRAGRAERKRAVAWRHQGEIKVITLRRTQHTARDDGEAVDVEWACRWIVRGHWRLQPYKEDKRWIWIMPYVKGPEDKPLKVPTATIFEVKR